MTKLVTVTSKDYIQRLKKEDVTLVYPLRFFSTGYEEYFDIDEIDEFVLINRILTSKELDSLDVILKNSHVKGIIFDDLGVLDVIKNLDITKILLLDHIANNSKSINYYLEYVDSVVVSSDLSYDEIEYITKNVNKKVVIYTFGLKALMYSRRTLVSNYEKHYNLVKNNIIDASINNKYFKFIETKEGTKGYAYPYYNGLSLLNLSNVLYFWYDPILLDIESIIKVLHGDISDVETSTIFLDKKTIYKVGELDA